MNYVLLGLSILSAIISIILLIMIIKDNKKSDSNINETELKEIKDAIKESMDTLSNTVSSLVAEKNRSLMDELSKDVKNLTNKMDDLIKSQKESESKENDFEGNLTKRINDNHKEIKDQFSGFEKQYAEDSNKKREEIINKLSDEFKKLDEDVNKTLDKFNASMKEKLEDFKNDTKDSIKALSDTVKNNLDEIRKDNNQKLEEINKSVNEKLEKTLKDNLEASFKSVVEGIQGVSTAVGEIKGLASDVGTLKNVLTNVKTKGIMGEVILGNIIKDFLTCGQYEENVITKKGSQERVEFAIVLPGTKDNKIYLPVDSKFPYEAYSKLKESNDVNEIDKARKSLKVDLLKYAKDVENKYIDVPNTTNFAIIFLPLEGLYLEALNMGLFEEIQSKCRVILVGPTTFAAFINSLNMGFKSLLIQKKSAQVFELLGAVKTEFNKFADSLEKTKKKVDAASDELDNLVTTRTKMLRKKLSNVDALDEESTKLLLGDNDKKNENEETTE